jgi:hypothetical protein
MEEYKCSTCQKVFKTAAGLKAHTTNKKVPCTPPQSKPAQPQPAQPIPQPLPHPQAKQHQQQSKPLPPTASIVKPQQSNQEVQAKQKQIDDPLGRGRCVAPTDQLKDLPKTFQDLMAKLSADANQSSFQGNRPVQNKQPQPKQQQPQQPMQQPMQQQPPVSAKGFDVKSFTEGMMSLQNQMVSQQGQPKQQSNKQPIPQQQVSQQQNQIANPDGIVNNNTKTFLNGKEIQPFREDYNPMLDYSIPYEERYQRMVAKIVNDVTTEENGKYANLGDPINLGRLTDRLNRVSGTMCMVNANNNGVPIIPQIPKHSQDEYMYDLFLRKAFSEALEDKRKRDRERMAEEERRIRKQKIRAEYKEAEIVRALMSSTIEEERKITGDMLYNLVCHQLAEFKLPDIQEMDTKSQQEFLDKKVLFMKRKYFYVNNVQDVVNKILLYELEYELKNTKPDTLKYEEIKDKYEKEKAIFENIMENDNKLEDIVRERMYKRLFDNLLKMLVDSVNSNSPDDHNELLMYVSRIRSDVEFYLFDRRRSIDEILRMLMSYDNEKYKQIQVIIFSNLHMSDNTSTTMGILDHENNHYAKLEKENKSLEHEFPKFSKI